MVLSQSERIKGRQQKAHRKKKKTSINDLVYQRGIKMVSNSLSSLTLITSITCPLAFCNLISFYHKNVLLQLICCSFTSLLSSHCPFLQELSNSLLGSVLFRGLHHSVSSSFLPFLFLPVPNLSFSQGLLLIISFVFFSTCLVYLELHTFAFSLLHKIHLFLL